MCRKLAFYILHIALKLISVVLSVARQHILFGHPKLRVQIIFFTITRTWHIESIAAR